MFLFTLIVAYCALYLGLIFLFPLFFGAPKPQLNKKTILPLFYIIGLGLIIFSITFAINDSVWRNRVQHGLGGGFLAFFVCFLVVRATEIKLKRFQFWFFSLLMVTALGVFNEILEFFLQNYFTFFFTANVNDTWLDLISNTAGIFLASFIFLPFVRYTGE